MKTLDDKLTSSTEQGDISINEVKYVSAAAVSEARHVF